MTVVVPRHGTPAASRGLVKAVAAEIKKENRVFQEQDHVSATELQGLVRMAHLAQPLVIYISLFDSGRCLKLERSAFKRQRRARASVGRYIPNVRPPSGLEPLLTCNFMSGIMLTLVRRSFSTHNCC